MLLAFALTVSAVAGFFNSSGDWASPVNTALLCVLAYLQYRFAIRVRKNRKEVPEATAEKVTESLQDGGADAVAEALLARGVEPHRAPHARTRQSDTDEMELP